ncbi:hypothetical protein TWF173_005645 [Orbilia oligospora]|nr:hypothetical protein TWF173_005645 [Orbilia oligospora]
MAMHVRRQRIPPGWARDEMLDSDVQMPIGLLGMPYDITFHIKAVTIKTKIGGYIGDWVAPDNTIVRNDDGQCSTLKYSTALVNTKNSKTLFDPVNINQQGFKECRKVVNISINRSIENEKKVISLGTLRIKTNSIIDLNSTPRPITLTLEYTIRRQKDPTKTGAGTLLKAGKLIISVSKFRLFGDPEEVYFAESNMNGSNLKQQTIKIADATPNPKLFISLIPGVKGKKGLGIALSYMKADEAPDIEKAMGFLLSGLEIAAKIGIQIALPGIGTAIVIAVEIVENIDLLVDVVAAFKKVFDVLQTCNVKKVANALRNLFDKYIAFGFAVFSIALNAVGLAQVREMPYLVNKLHVLFAKSLPRSQWAGAVGKSAVIQFSSKVAETLLTLIPVEKATALTCPNTISRTTITPTIRTTITPTIGTTIIKPPMI